MITIDKIAVYCCENSGLLAAGSVHDTEIMESIDIMKLPCSGKCEMGLILKTLEKTNFNRSEAASILGVTSRTLSNKLKIYRQENHCNEGEYLPAALAGRLSPV